MRISIRYKILGVLGILLIAAVCFYTLLASAIFKEEKTALLYDINHSIAANTAAQVHSQLAQLGDQLKLYALSHILSEKSELRLPAKHLQEAHIVAAQLFLKNGTSYNEVKLPAEVPPTRIDFDKLEPYLKQADDTRYAFWDQTASEQTPRFFLATRLEILAGGQSRNYIAVAELEGKPFFEALQAANLFQSYLVNTEGETFVHVDRTQALPAKTIADHPLLAAVRSKNATSGVLSFDYEGQRWYGAYAPVGIGGLYFLSQASRSEVTEALNTLVKRSLLFGLIVITVTFIASILFSKRLTRNLQTLALGAQAIGEGKLTSHIDIKSGDEVERLATSFNSMASALRASREAIERYNRELEEKVALRTQQLHETNAAIKEVQEKLLRSTQLAAVGEVAGRTAHELLNPLTAIIGRLERSRLLFTPQSGAAASSALPTQFAEILSAWESDFRAGGMPQLTKNLEAPSQIKPEMSLLEEDLDNLKKLAAFWQQQTQVVANDLDFVQDQAQRIHRIIDRMRELVRSSVKTEITCHDALDEACKTMHDFMTKRGIALDRTFTASSDRAVLNRDELIQITTNLMRNSLQAIESRGLKEGGKIAVHTESHGNLLAIDIVDNGCGIPEEKQRFLFEQGFTTKGPSEGTGLGLAICRRYAHAFGGEVELLYSEPEGRGTCFRITIPLKESESAKIAS